MPILVVFEILLVVLVFVAYEIFERKPVVSRYKINGCEGTATRPFVEIAGPSDPCCNFAVESLIAPPVAAHRIAVAPVPLGPLPRKSSYLIAPRSHIPRLGNKLHLTDDRILLNDLEERGQHVNVVELTRQC